MKYNIYKNIRKLIAIQKRHLVFCIFLILALSGVEILSLNIFSNLVSLIQNDDLNPQKDLFHASYPNEKSTLIFLICALLLSISLKFAINIFLNYNLMSISITNENNLKLALLKRYLESAHKDFFSYDQGHFLYHFQQLTKTFSEFLLLPLIRMVSDIIITLTISIYLILFYPMLFSVLSSVFVIFYFTYNYFFKKALKTYGEKYNLSAQYIIGDFKSAMNGKDQIKHYSYWNTLDKKIQKNCDDYKQSYVKAVIISNLPRYLVEVLIGIAVAAYIVASLVFGISKEVIITSLGVMGFSAVRLVPIVNQILVSLNQINTNSNSLKRLQDDLESRFHSDLKCSNSLISDKTVELKLRSAQMIFQIDDLRKEIKLSDITVKTGLTVSIVGKSGSGKSTLAKVISGLVPLTSGTIFVNGLKIIPEQSSILQTITSYAPQEVFELGDTIKENIVFGRPYDALALKQAIFAANAEEFISELPEKENTLIGANGVCLSGGQVQRLQIARTLYLARPIIILDEPTSALNRTSATKIVERIREKYKDKIVFIITHDEHISMFTDLTINLNEGNVI